MCASLNASVIANPSTGGEGLATMRRYDSNQNNITIIIVLIL